MPHVIDSSGLIDNDWIRLSDDDPIGDQAKFILSLSRLKSEGKQLRLLPTALGVLLEPTSDVDDLLPFLDHLRIILLQFKVFTDGRAFSQANLLRNRYAFGGDIRAVGEVLPDQLLFMRRCGFNQFEMSQREDIQLANKAFSEITQSYQPILKRSVG